MSRALFFLLTFFTIGVVLNFKKLMEERICRLVGVMRPILITIVKLVVIYPSRVAYLDRGGFS